MTTLFSGSPPTSRKACGNSPWGRSPHCSGPPSVWNVIWRMPSRRSMRMVWYFVAYSEKRVIGPGLLDRRRLIRGDGILCDRRARRTPCGQDSPRASGRTRGRPFRASTKYANSQPPWDRSRLAPVAHCEHQTDPSASRRTRGGDARRLNGSRAPMRAPRPPSTTKEDRTMRHALRSVSSIVCLWALAMAQPAFANEVVHWNETAMKAIVANGQNNIVSTRTLAMVQVAVHDALNAIDRRYG